MDFFASAKDTKKKMLLDLRSSENQIKRKRRGFVFYPVELLNATVHPVCNKDVQRTRQIRNMGGYGYMNSSCIVRDDDTKEWYLHENSCDTDTQTPTEELLTYMKEHKKTFLLVNAIDKIHMYICRHVTERSLAASPLQDTGRVRRPKSCMSSLFFKANTEVLSSSNPNGTSSTYKTAPRLLAQTANVFSDAYDDKWDDDGDNCLGGTKPDICVSCVNVNMCMGFDELLLFQRSICATYGDVHPLTYTHALTTCSSTVHDPFSGIVNEVTADLASSKSPLFLMAKESFHANKIVVHVPTSASISSSTLSFRRQVYTDTAKKAISSSKDGRSIPLEVQFYRRCCNFSGRSCMHSPFVLCYLMTEIERNNKESQSPVKLDFFLANAKAYASRLSGSLNSASLIDYNEILSRTLQTASKSTEEQLQLFFRYALRILNLLNISRENYAQFGGFSSGRQTGSPLTDKEDCELLSLKYDYDKTLDFLYNEAEELNPGENCVRKGKRKFKCKDLCVKRMRKEGFVMKYTKGTVRYRRNIGLSAPTQDEI